MAESENKTEKQITLKLVVNTDTNKVLFAQSEKDFVDVVFSFLTLPLGTIARLARKETNIAPVTVGCLNSLYQSVFDLDKRLFVTSAKTEMLLQPKNSSEDYCSSLKLNIDDTPPTMFYICTNISGGCSSRNILHKCFSDKNCRCGNPLTRSVFLEHFSCNGFVESGATFVITDDLAVMPYSKHFTTFGLLQKLGIKSISSVKEMTFNVTKDQVLDLLKFALMSKSPLTDLFLAKKLSLGRSLMNLNYDIENSSNIQISVKLVVRKSDNKVLFAQGEEDFADLLLSFLTFPLGGVVSKLRQNCCLGSIDRLYKCIVDLDANKYFMSTEAKQRLLDPHVSSEFKMSNKIIPFQEERRYSFYSRCENFQESIIQNKLVISHSLDYGYASKNCRNMVVVYNSESGGRNYHEGYVKGLKTYVVTDDLVVASSSPILFLNLLNEFNLGDIKEIDVIISIKECLSILRAALTSTSALTNGLAHLLTPVKEEK